MKFIPSVRGFRGSRKNHDPFTPPDPFYPPPPYSRFFQSLLNSSSREVSFLANIVSRDCQSVTAKNVEHAVGCTTMRIKAGLKKPPAP